MIVIVKVVTEIIAVVESVQVSNKVYNLYVMRSNYEK